MGGGRYVGTKAMEPVSMFLHRHEPAQARAIEDAARPGRVAGIEQPAIDWPAFRDFRDSRVRRRSGPRRSRDRRRDRIRARAPADLGHFLARMGAEVTILQRSAHRAPP